MSATTWKYRTNTTINDPNNGNLRLNAADLTLATMLAIAHKSQDLTDVSGKIAQLTADDTIRLTSADTPAKWAEYELAAAPVMQATWSSLAVAYRAGALIPPFADAEAVTILLVGEAIQEPGTILVPLTDAKVHLHITDAARDAEVTQYLTQASALIYQYLGARADPSWDEDSAPAIVQAATLKMLGHLYEHRGDDASDDHDEKIWAGISALLMRTRDPAIA